MAEDYTGMAIGVFEVSVSVLWLLMLLQKRLT